MSESTEILTNQPTMRWICSTDWCSSERSQSFSDSRVCQKQTNKQRNKQTKSLLLSLLSQLDRTEVIKSNLHPVFAKVFSLDYYFEEVQKLRFEVYDIHGTHSIGTRDDDFLGGVECTLGQVGRRLRPSLKTQLCNDPEACSGRPLSAPLTSSVGSVADKCSPLLLTTPFILTNADRCPEEDGEAPVAEVREICWQIHHHGRFVLFLQAFCTDACWWFTPLWTTANFDTGPFQAPQGHLPSPKRGGDSAEPTGWCYRPSQGSRWLWPNLVSEPQTPNYMERQALPF